MKRILCILFAFTIIFTSIPSTVFAGSVDAVKTLDEFSDELNQLLSEYTDDDCTNSDEYEPKRVIVKSKFRVNPLDSVDIIEGFNDLHIIQFDNAYSAEKAVSYYNSLDFIEYAELDQIVSISDISSSKFDTISSKDTPSENDGHLSWGSSSIKVDTLIDYLGDESELRPVIVATIDTGVDYTNTFLSGRIKRTNFNSCTSGFNRDTESDDNGHGTHVAGIIADNTTSNVKISAYKALDYRGNGSESAIILAVEKAIDDGVNVINMSLGFKGKQIALEDTVKEALDRKITVCIAAGNDGVDASAFSPARLSGCITVSAIDSKDNLPDWANWGKVVDIVAPGDEIVSTFLSGTYATSSGTSMSCPFVSAATALILSADESAGCSDVEKMLKDNGRIWNTKHKGERDLYGVPALYLENIKPHFFSNPVQNSKSTCDKAGTVTYTCSDCGKKKSVNLPKLPHNYKTTTTKATLTKSGSVVSKCTVCGNTKTSKTFYYPKYVLLSNTSYTYNGSSRNPTVIIRDEQGTNLTEGVDYTLTIPSGRKKVGKYKYVIKFKGNYTGTKNLYMSINPKSVNISTLRAKSKGFTVKWKEQKVQTTGYQIQYSTDKNFKKNNKTVTISKNTTTSKSISKLKGGKNYYVRIRTFKEINGTKYCSAWSAIKTIKTNK